MLKPFMLCGCSRYAAWEIEDLVPETRSVKIEILCLEGWMLDLVLMNSSWVPAS